MLPSGESLSQPKTSNGVTRNSYDPDDRTLIEHSSSSIAVGWARRPMGFISREEYIRILRQEWCRYVPRALMETFWPSMRGSAVIAVNVQRNSVYPGGILILILIDTVRYLGSVVGKLAGNKQLVGLVMPCQPYPKVHVPGIVTAYIRFKIQGRQHRFTQDIYPVLHRYVLEIDLREHLVRQLDNGIDAITQGSRCAARLAHSANDALIRAHESPLTTDPSPTSCPLISSAPSNSPSLNSI